MTRWLLFVCLASSFTKLWAQTAHFISPATACLGQNITLTNNSTGATSYLWDFCQDGLLNPANTVTNVGTVLSSIPVGIEVVYDQGVWYGFVCGRDNSSSNKLVRLNFGSSLNNTPTAMTDYDATVNSVLSGASEIKFTNISGNWYGFVVNYYSGNIVRINFGSSLSNDSPTVLSLGNPGGWSGAYGIEIIINNGNYILAVAGNSSNTITFLNYTTTIDSSTPAVAATSTLNSTTNSLISSPVKIGLQQNAGNWYALFSSLNGRVVMLDLGNDPMSSPVVTSVADIPSASALQFKKDGNNYFCFVQNNAGNLYRLDFGSSITTSPLINSLGDYGGVGNVYGLCVVKEWPSWKSFFVTVSSSVVYRLDFTDQCTADVSVLSSFSSTPSGINYGQSGSKVIELAAFDNAFNISTFQSTISVSALTGPTVDFSVDNSCLAAPITFTGSSSDPSALSSGAWDFGDSNVGSGNSTIHTYSSAGTYQVRLSIAGQNGCPGSVVKSVNIYNAPVSDFSVPPGTICTGQAQVFTNSSTYDNGSNPAWTWYVDNIQVSATTDLSELFPNTGSHDIKLTASIPGCSSEKTTTISLQSGPTVDFNYTHNCFGQAIQFTNTTTGTGVTSFAWDFGDGNSDTSQSNTQHIFAQGDFSVQLTVNNNIGCSNKKTVPISVRNQPLADFSYSNAIENLPTYLQGQALTLSDDAVNQWTWTINNSQPVGGQSTNFTFPSPGNYSGSLSVITNQGCSFTVMKTISIAASTMPTIQTSFIPSSCLDETVNFQNSSVNTSAFTWDFCFEDLKHITNVVPMTTVPSALVPEGIKTAYDLGIYYAFMTSRENNKLFRIKLGADISLADPADIVDLNISGLSNPTDLRLVKDNNIWYALIINLGNGHLVRLRFGNGLASSPDQTTDLGTFGILEQGIRGFDLAFDGTNWLAGFVNFSNDKVYSVNFGSSLASISAISSNSFASPLIKSPTSVALIEDTNSWKMVVTSYSTNQIVIINYGVDFLSTPAATSIANVYPANSPFEIALVKEGLNYYAYVISGSGELHYLNFGTSVSTGLVESSNQGKFGILANGTALDIVRTSPNWKGLVIDYYNLKITKIYFSSNCSYASEQESNLRNPTDFYFSTAGSYPVELTAYHQNGNIASQQTIVNVSSQAAPSLNFTVDNSRCVNVTNTFTSQTSENLTHTTWNFGDGTVNDGTNTSVNHTFTSTGQQTISLAAKGVSGCGNFKSQTISIFNPPAASFDLPTASPYCSNQSYKYTNTSVFDHGSNPSWQWIVNGQNVSTTQDLDYLFTTTTAQNVSLIASIPGCSSQSNQAITGLITGPLVKFNSSATGCEGSAIPFTNATTDPVIGFLWTFGDGNSFIANGPSNTSNTYAATGQYQVKLSATNAAGCQNSLSKSIVVYSNPQPDFSIESPPLSCERWPAQFDNLTPPLLDSNIASWVWSFADVAGGLSNQKNPTYTYNSADTYKVTLQATSNFGCTKTVQKNVTIFPAPKASLKYTTPCVDQSMIFTSTTQGGTTSLQWNIENTLPTGANVPHTFASSGNFPVTLIATSINGCISQVDTTVKVPVVPTLDFSVQAPCTNRPSTFQELYPGGADPTASWNWSFGQGGSSGSQPTFQFVSTGTYAVNMTTTRQSGCVYSFSKNVTIGLGPTAYFTPSVFAGAAPLNVTFDNASTADSYSWAFGDNAQSTSNEVSPTFSYQNLGRYKPLLTAKNSLGCTDTLSVEIDVVIPRIEIVMNSFSLSSDPISNVSKPVVGILNSGNIPLVNPEVLIDLGGGASLKEKISGMVRPGKSILQTMDLQIVPQGIKYVCAEINVTDDVNSTNNKQCISLSSDDVLMNPYPNPSSSGQVTLQWIGATQENVRITVYKSNGDIAFAQDLDTLQSGLGQLTINTSSFANGLYLIQFAGNKMNKTFRIVIAN